MQIYSDKKAVLKRKRNFRIKIYFLIFLGIIFLFGIYYLMVYSQVFVIKAVSVEGNKFLTQDDVLRNIKQISLSSFLGSQAGFNNIFSWPSGKINSENPAISELIVKKNWFKRSITIEVHERERFAIWCRGEGVNCYWMDKDGVVFGTAPLTEGSLVFTVFDSNNTDLLLGSRVEEDRFIGNLIAILENLNKTGFDVNKVFFDSSLKELKTTTTEGITLIFSIRFNPVKNMSLLKNIDFQKAKYIDLTVENKIYYK